MTAIAETDVGPGRAEGLYTQGNLAERATGLVERASELEELGARLAAARQGVGSVLVVEAPSGTGKSSLLGLVEQEAHAMGMGVLSCRGVELECEFPFGAAIRLLGPALDRLGPQERRRALSGFAANAAGLFHPATAEVPLEGPDHERSVVRSLRQLTVNLALSRALHPHPSTVVILDDAQWSDTGSLRFLAHLGTDITRLPILVVAACEAGSGGARAVLRQMLASSPGARRLRLARLSREGVAYTVRQSYPDAPPSFVNACALASGGNPFYLRELLSSALAEGVQGDLEGAARLRELVPQAVTDSVLLRLSRVCEPAATLAAAVSVLGDGASLRHAALLAEIPADKAEQAADLLAEVQVLGDGEPLRFTEALTGAAIHESLPTLFRSRLHKRAAELLEADGAEIDAIAAHLLASQPHGDPAAVGVLRSAAERAAARGDARSAQRFLDRALAEPSPIEVQPELVMDRALAHAATGTPDAITHLRESLAVAGTPSQRAELMGSLGRLLFARAEFRAAAEALEQALGELRPGDPQEASLVVDSMAVASVAGSSPLPAAAARLEALVGEALSGQLPSDPRLLALASTAVLQAGRPASLVAATAKEALCGLPIDDNLYGVLNGAAVTSLIAAGDLEAARSRIEDCLQEGAAASPIRAGMANHLLAVVSYCQGDLEATAMACRRSLGALQVGWDICTGWVAPLLAHALMDQGDLGAAAVALGFCLSAGPDRPEHLMAQTARALLQELEGGDSKAVASELLAVGRKIESSGLNRLTPQPWRSLAALAAARVGERDQALRLAEEELDHARAFGEARALGIALRTAGVVKGGPEGTEMLRSAVEVLEGSPAQLELARALVDYGAALRRASHKVASRSPLRRGLDLAASLGAKPLAQRAHDELRAAGGRRGAPRDKFGPGALTPAERRVAELAASGLSTPQLARRLHVSAKTVDWHLGHVDQKLGISSRRQLQSSLAQKPRRV